MIILASTSKRRIRLIKKITNNFKCEKPLIDEDNFNYLNNSILSKELSKLKAYSILNDEYKNDLIISADTVVIYKNNILHKPRNRIEAFNTLKKLSGNKHIVLTSYTLLYKDKEINNTIKTSVFFKKLSDEEINNYLDMNTYKDKAGGYGIQNRKYKFVDKIIGSYNNVVGFPIEYIIKDIKKIGYEI